MAERTTRTEEIVLGDAIITGERTDSRGRFIEPTADVTVKVKDVKLSLDKDIGKIKPVVNISYKEATQEEDVAHFFLEISDNNGKIIGEAGTTSKETRARFDKLDGQLGAEIDITDWSNKTIQLKARLRCWLEESKWEPRGGGEEKVSDEDFVNITLEVPQIKEAKQNPIVSFNVVGRRLAKDEQPKDYAQQDIGKDYRVVATITNSTGNKLTYGELDLFENNNLLSYLSQGIKEIEAGKIYPVTYKFTKSWNWHKVEPDGKLTIKDSKAKEFIYKFKYYLRDEYGYDYAGVVDKPLSKVKIVISIPQAKLDAIKVYNWSFDEEDSADFWSLVLALALLGAGATAGFIITKLIQGAAAGGAAGGAAGFGFDLGSELSEWFLGETVESAARKLRAKLLKLINDPPTFDREYRRLVLPKIETLKIPKFKTKYGKTLCKAAKLKLLIGANIDALITTSDRLWSAGVKKDAVIIKKQRKAYNRFRNKLANELNILAEAYESLAKQWTMLNIKFTPAEFLSFKRYVRRHGLPKLTKSQFYKSGFSNKKIRKFENAVSCANIGKSDVTKQYLEHSKSLRRLAASIRKLK